MFESVDPPRGGKVEHWEFVTVGRGAKIKGWLAGPVVGVEVHYLDRSKGCVLSLTKGRAPCKWCDGGMGKKWIGYTPIYLPAGSKGVIGIKKDNLETVRGIPLHSAIVASRGEKYHAATIIQSVPLAAAFSSKRADLQEPADIREWLIRLWRMPELVELLQAVPEATTSPVVLASTPMPPPEVVDVPRGRKFNFTARPGDRVNEWFDKREAEIADHTIKNGKPKRKPRQK